MNHNEQLGEIPFEEIEDLSTDLSATEKLRKKASDKAWETLFMPWILERGRDYACAGKVSDIQEKTGIVCAKVQGRDNYDVWIHYNHFGEIEDIQCTCPYAAEGKCCKHSAAVLYTINSDLKPLEVDDFYVDDEFEDDIEATEEYVSLRLSLESAEDVGKVANTVKDYVGDIQGANWWIQKIQVNHVGCEITVDESTLCHEAYDEIFPGLFQKIAKIYPGVSFECIAEYSEMWGDSGEVCLARSDGRKLTILHIASGCRLAICPECDMDLLSLSEMAEILLYDPEVVLTCGACGAEYNVQELFEDDWGLAPSWTINTYNIT